MWKVNLFTILILEGILDKYLDFFECCGLVFFFGLQVYLGVCMVIQQQ